jgi:hypothetical protein
MFAPTCRKAAGVFIPTFMETVVFIDFENLKGKIKKVFRSSNKKNTDVLGCGKATERLLLPLSDRAA